MEDFFPSYDLNSDGEISVEEITAGLKLAEPEQSVQSIANAYEWMRKHGKGIINIMKNNNDRNSFKCIC